MTILVYNYFNKNKVSLVVFDDLYGFVDVVDLDHFDHFEQFGDFDDFGN